MLERLTFLRFIAAIAVVIFHFRTALFPPEIAASWLVRTYLNGPVAVSFFYTLSGFVMAMIYSRITMKDAKSYWLARFARVYPVYCLAMVCAFYTAPAAPLGIALHLTMLQAFVPGYALSVNAPGWSLSAEMFFYLLFPILMIWLRRVGLSVFLTISAMGWLVTQAWATYLLNQHYAAYPSPEHDFLFYFPPHHLTSFMLGMAAGSLVKGNHVKLSATAAKVMVWSAVALYTLAAWFIPLTRPYLGVSIPQEVGFHAPIFALLCVGVYFLPSRQTVRPSFIFLGEASYSLYILQMPVINFVIVELSAWGIVGLSGSVWIGVGLLLTTSLLIFPFYERPMRGLLRSLGRVRNVPPAHIA